MTEQIIALLEKYRDEVNSIEMIEESSHVDWSIHKCTRKYANEIIKNIGVSDDVSCKQELEDALNHIKDLEEELSSRYKKF
jgi:hypothetical protein